MEDSSNKSKLISLTLSKEDQSMNITNNDDNHMTTDLAGEEKDKEKHDEALKQENEANNSKKRKLGQESSKNGSYNMGAAVIKVPMNFDLNKLPSEVQYSWKKVDRIRSCWVKERSGAWWNECNKPDYPGEEFKKIFKMSRATFDMICEELSPFIAKKDINLRAPIPTKTRVAACIWRLAHGAPLSLVAERFGLGISTCTTLILEVCSAIKDKLMPKYLQWPDDDRTLCMISNEFMSKSGIPNVVGSMYTTHVPIIAPWNSNVYYNMYHTQRNQKPYYSITLNGVVDHRGVFTSVTAGLPGSMLDYEVLEKTPLYQKANEGMLGHNWIVGSSGYTLMDWLLVPYNDHGHDQNLNWKQHYFNARIAQIQKVAKDAFSRLKGRWGYLRNRCDMKLKDLVIVLEACCVLHNICELRNEGMDPESEYEVVDADNVARVSVRSINTFCARETICDAFFQRGF